MMQFHLYMKKQKISKNTAHYQMWMAKLLQRNNKQTCDTILENLSGIDTYENIHLIQACVTMTIVKFHP